MFRELKKLAKVAIALMMVLVSVVLTNEKTDAATKPYSVQNIDLVAEWENHSNHDVYVCTSAENGYVYMHTLLAEQKRLFFLEFQAGIYGKQPVDLIQNGIMDDDDLSVTVVDIKGEIVGTDHNGNFIVYGFVVSYIKGDDKSATVAATALAKQLAYIDSSDYIKAKACYNWIVSNIVYDDVTPDDMYDYKCSASSALSNKSCICLGYASLYHKMLQGCGVKSRIVCGNTSQGYHAWNDVVIDGITYHCDACWDAGLKESEWMWFLNGDKTFEDHTPVEYGWRGKTYASSSVGRRVSTSDYKKSDCRIYTVVRSGKSVRVRVAKTVKGRVSGYQIQYSYNKHNWYGAKKITVKGTSAKFTVKAGKKVYIRVRSYAGGEYGDYVHGCYSKPVAVSAK